MALMECPSCKELVSDKAKTCVKCLHPLTVACTDCGSDVRYPAMQCSNCGCPLGEVASEIAAERAVSVSEIASLIFDAGIDEWFDKKRAELLKPLSAGIYVSKNVSVHKHVYGMFKHGYNRGILQFFEDGTAIFNTGLVARTELFNEEALRGIKVVGQEAYREWKMDDQYIVIKDRVGRALNARVVPPDTIVLGNGTGSGSDDVYVFIKTDHKLRTH